MRESWELKKLDTLIIENPKSKFKVRDSFDKGDYVFFTSGIKTKKMNTFLIDGENIFLSTGGQAIVSYYNGKASYSTDAYSIKGNPINLNTKFLYYFILLNLDKIDKNMFKGAALKHLQKKDFKNLSISTPSMQQQKEIVEILDQAFQSIEKAKTNIEKNIENAKELFQSKLNQIFFQKGEGWEIKKLNDICEVKDGTHDSPKYVDEKDGVPFITQKNILDDGLSFEKVKFISQEDHNHFYKRSNVAYNDILFSMIGANRGMACVVDNKKIFSIKNVGLIKSNNQFLSKFILYFLKSPIAKKYVSENSSGSAQGFIALGKLRSFTVPFINITKQKEIVETLDIVDNHIQSLLVSYEEELKNLEELKKSILQKAFSGELTNKNKAA